MIIKHDIEIFWYVLKRQIIDIREDNMNVIFAGEAAADVGGPHYKFRNANA